MTGRDRLIRFLWVVGIALLAACSRQDPMEIPMKAATIEEYCESMRQIGMAIEDATERDWFMSALEVVAFGPDTALSYQMLPEALSGEQIDNMQRLARRCDGKTPREIIALAEAVEAGDLEVEEMEPSGGDVVAGLAALSRDDVMQVFGVLRAVDAAKARWRKEYRPEPGVVPAPEDLLPFYRIHGGPDWSIDPETGEALCLYRGKPYTWESRELYEILENR